LRDVKRLLEKEGMKQLARLIIVLSMPGVCLSATSCKDDEEKPPVATPLTEAEPASAEQPKATGTAQEAPTGMQVKVAEVEPKGEKASTVERPAPGETPRPRPRPAPAAPPPARQMLPDLRLLLTATDVARAADGKTGFRRRGLPGVEASDEQDAIYYEPVKGASFGFAIQVFRERDSNRTKQRFESMFASYPNAVEVAPVAGNTFFAYWDEVLFISFMHPYNGLIVVLSCGRRYCDSDSVYELASKVSARIR